jgi:hypothetical protein
MWRKCHLITVHLLLSLLYFAICSQVTGNSCQLCGLGVAMEASQPSDDDSVEEVPLSNRFRAPAHWLNT